MRAERPHDIHAACAGPQDVEPEVRHRPSVARLLLRLRCAGPPGFPITVRTKSEVGASHQVTTASGEGPTGLPHAEIDPVASRPQHGPFAGPAVPPHG